MSKDLRDFWLSDSEAILVTAFLCIFVRKLSVFGAYGQAEDARKRCFHEASHC